MRRIDVRADRSQSGYENMAIGGVGKALSNGMQENFQEFKLADTTIQATSGTFLQENGGCNLAMPGVAPPVASLTSTQNPTTGDLTVSFTITGIPTTAVTASGVIPLGQRIARIIIGDVVPGPPFVFSQAHPNNPTIGETCKYYQALNTGQVGQILGVVEIQVPAGQSTATSSITFADPGAVGAGGLTASFSANILTVNPPPGLQANTGALTHLYLGVL